MSSSTSSFPAFSKPFSCAIIATSIPRSHKAFPFFSSPTISDNVLCFMVKLPLCSEPLNSIVYLCCSSRNHSGFLCLIILTGLHAVKVVLPIMISRGVLSPLTIYPVGLYYYELFCISSPDSYNSYPWPFINYYHTFFYNV